MNKNGEIRVVIFREGDQYVAQCLEVDIGAQAEDIDTVKTRLEMTLRAEHMSRKGTDADPFPGIDPAPDYFHEKWEQCEFRAAPVPVSGMDHGKSLKMALCA